ncbi:MAG: Holliday junction resolvase RuvX [Sandaracinaceae bacterium]|nr:Holliday junction resolvase RuvX [Sandaracinaceae bacterium]
MRRLAIDHGERRVGLALSDEGGTFATPYATWERGDPSALLTRLAELVASEGVGEIVVGLPLHLDGREGASARRARRFAELLEQRAGVPVVLWDERLSSAAAERALREGGVRAKEQKGKLDRVAAALLLSSYLDSRARAGDDLWDASEPSAARAERSSER